METPELTQAQSEMTRLNELEQKVGERTRELATTNEALRSEIAERKLAVEAMKHAEHRLRLHRPEAAQGLEDVHDEFSRLRHRRASPAA